MLFDNPFNNLALNPQPKDPIQNLLMDLLM